MAQDKKQERVYQMQGAGGFYHSVPESKVAEFQRQQKQLEESGELEERLRTLDQKASAYLAEKRRKK